MVTYLKYRLMILLPIVTDNLEGSTRFIFQWFENSEMQRNASKCHILLNTNRKVIEKAESADTENRQSEKLFGVTVDNQLCFEKHINNVCRKTKTKPSVLSQTAFLINFNQKKTLMNPSCKKELNYCPLVRVLHISKPKKRR